MSYKMVNQAQSAEERREKYWLAISCGAMVSWARAMRDWRYSKIERYFAQELGGKEGQAMKPTLITVRKEHNCFLCDKTIRVGQKAVKTKTSRASYVQTEVYSVYCHEACWIEKRGGK